MKGNGRKSKAAGYAGFVLMILGIVGVVLSGGIGILDFLIIAVCAYVFYRTIVKKAKLTKIEWVLFALVVSIIALSLIIGLWYALAMISSIQT
jgi:hypothetical protein